MCYLMPLEEIIQFKIISMNFTLYFPVSLLNANRSFNSYAESPKLHTYLAAHRHVFILIRTARTLYETNSPVVFSLDMCTFSFHCLPGAY